MWLEALIVTISAILAQHLGLASAIVGVVTKISRCPKCLSFWAVLITLIILRVHIIVAIGLSLVCAYLSNWLGLILMLLANIYNDLWIRINQRK